MAVLAVGLLLVPVTTLRDHVRHVLLLRPEEQVIEVHAPWVVTGVEDAQAGRDGAIGLHPHPPVRQPHLTVDADTAVVAGS